MEIRYSSAFLATLRGSRENGSRVNGSWTKNLTFRVFALRNGSIRAVLRSGSSAMSDSSMEVKPRTEDPSNARPSVIASSSNADAGMVKCCSVPGTSVKRTSTNSTPSSLIYATTSSGVLKDMCGLLSWPWLVRGGAGYDFRTPVSLSRTGRLTLLSLTNRAFILELEPRILPCRIKNPPIRNGLRK